MIDFLPTAEGARCIFLHPVQHQNGQSRKLKDSGNEKGDIRRKFASIFTNCDPASGSFIYGIVLYAGDDYFVIKMYDRAGIFDGYALLSTDKILYIETDGQYHQSM